MTLRQRQILYPVIWMIGCLVIWSIIFKVSEAYYLPDKHESFLLAFSKGISHFVAVAYSWYFICITVIFIMIRKHRVFRQSPERLPYRNTAWLFVFFLVAGIITAVNIFEFT